MAKVTINTEENKVTVLTDGTNKIVKVTATDPNQIVKVLTQGPKGDKGDPGELTGNFVGNFKISGSLTVTGSGIIIVGPLSASGTITAPSFSGSLHGTASYYNETDPFFSSVSGSLATTGSNLFIGNEIISGTLSVVGDSKFIGDVQITGSLNVQSITGSLHGTSSWAQYALTASYASSASYFFTQSVSTASYVNPLRQNVIVTGSLLVTQSYISTVDWIDFTTNPAQPAHLEGRIHWNVDRKTLQIDTEVNNFMIASGHVNVIRGRNTSGGTLTKGTVIYITGNSGQFPTFGTASWEDDPRSAYTIGLIAQDIAPNNSGYAVIQGEITGINTNGFTPATLLYLSSSGQYTDQKPLAPLHAVRLGQVVVASTNGSIQVKVDNGYETDELHDVHLHNTASGDLFIKSGSLWVNSKQLTGSYGLTGSLAISGTLFATNVNATASYVDYANVFNKPTLFSGSSQVELSQISGTTFADTTYTFPGDVIVQGNATVEQLIISTSVYYVTTSFSSGSTMFGNSLDDTHRFVGTVFVSNSMQITGSLLVSGAIVARSISSSFTGSLVGSLIGTASNAISASYAATASYALNAGISIFTQTGSFYSTTNNIVITGSTPLLNSPDGTVTNKYAFEVSQSIWANNINVGYPTSNNWQTNLNGSYFNNFNQNTDVSEILRFIAGLLSSSAPDASPNTRTYSTYTANTFSTTTGTVTAGSIPQSSTNPTILYLNSRGFANAGSTIFAGISPIYTTGLYSESYTSVAAGSTTVSSSVDTQLFGLGSLSNGIPTTFSVSGSFVFRFKDNSSKTDTATSASAALVTQTGAGTTSGVTLAKINTVNPAVIPAAYQDGKFVAVFSPAIFSGSSAPGVSSSGYYHISTSISIASGSGNFSTPITRFVEIFNAPLTTISTNVPANTITSTNPITASVTATSRSLSGAPYLTGATYTVSSSITGAFSPLYYAGAGIATQTTSGTGITQTSGVTTVSTAGGTIQTANAVFDSTGVTPRATSTIPFESDTIKLNGLYTFAAGTSTNIAQSSITPTTFTVTTNAFNKNGSNTGYNTQTISYHTAGTFGQPSASGSLAYWNGGANAPTTLIEYFNSESYRRVISDYTTLTTIWNATTPLTLGDTGSLQVKPGYLVNPESTDGYWYPTSGYNSGHYKWYLREFDTAAVANRTTLTITLLPGTSADLVDFSTTTTDKISIGVIFQATSGTIFDAVKGNNSYGGTLNSQAKGYLNPFNSNVNIVGDFSTFTNSNGTLTLGLNNVIGQTINATFPKIWLLIRYKGKPTNALTRITVSTA